jgi:two-component system, OmpR family, sensor histidine kinase VicK
LSDNSEKTEVICGSENIINRALEGLSKAKKRFDNCSDDSSPSAYVSTKPMWQGLLDLKNRGVKIRFITQITKENISYCKQIMKVTELRHLEGVKGNFGIADGIDYRGTATVEKNLPPSEAIRSTVKSFVEQQQLFFDMLWNKAIPAEQKIKEIEEGIIPDYIETKSDPEEIRRLELELLKSAKEEVLIIFPTTSSFRSHNEYEVGSGGEGPDSISLVQLLKELSNTNPQIRIKIITPSDSTIHYTVQALREQQQRNNIAVQYSVQPLESTVSVLVIDRKFSLSVEVKEEPGEQKFEKVRRSFITGLATYSNSRSTVLSYASIFESLWKQAELYEELRKSKTQLLSAQDELEEMKKYVNEALSEVGRAKK